jgi:hypothetical protein
MLSSSDSYNCNTMQSSRDPVGNYGVGSNISVLKTNSDAGYSSNSSYSTSGYCSSAAADFTGGYSSNGCSNGSYISDGYSNGGYSSNSYSNGGYSTSGYSNGSYTSKGYSNGGYTNSGYSNGGYTSSGYSNGGYSSNGYANDGYSTTGYSTGGYCTDGYSTADHSSVSYSNSGHSIDTTCMNGGYSTAAIPVTDPSNSMCPLERLARSLLQLDVGGAQRPDNNNDNTAVPVVAVEDPELDSLVNSIIDDE